MKGGTAFWLGFILVGISIVAFNNILWGFIIGELLGLSLITFEKILCVLSEQSGEKLT